MARSRAYPTIGLPKAIDAVRMLWDKHQRTVVTPEEAAKSLNYKGINGPSRSKLSAMKQYGLLEESGKGLKVTPRAVTIIVKPKDTEEYASAIRSCLADVELFAELAEKFPDASEAFIQTELLTTYEFIKSGAKNAAESFLETKALVDSVGSPTMDSKVNDDDLVGKYVQWESNGVAQFQTPRLVTGASENGEWLFVEGSANGIAASEVTIVDAPAKPKGSTMTQITEPPANPQFKPHAPEAGVKRDVYGLDEGDVVVQWPAKISQASYDELSEWFDLLKRKLGRAVVKGTIEADDDE